MICLDTNALIYAVEPRTGTADWTDRVRHYLERLRDANTPVIIPVPVLFEFLCKYPRDRHDGLRQSLAGGYILFDVTPQVASEAAWLFQTDAGGGTSRQQRKMDLLVAASAVVAGASEVVSEDRDYSQMTAGRLRWQKVSDLPLPPPGLFDRVE